MIDAANQHPIPVAKITWSDVFPDFQRLCEVVDSNLTNQMSRICWGLHIPFYTLEIWKWITHHFNENFLWTCIIYEESGSKTL
jgi:hypothetical protein